MPTFNIKLYTGEESNKSGQFPIVLLITWKEQNRSKSRRKRLGISCYDYEWDFNMDRFKDTIYGYAQKNEELEEALFKAQSILNSMDKWDYAKWAKLFKNINKIKGNREEQVEEIAQGITFDQWADELCEEYNNRGQAGTSDHYKCAKRALQKFMKKDKIAFEEITEEVLFKLERYQIANGYVGRRNFVGLKVIIGAAVKRKVIKKELMPFYCGYNPTGYSFAHLNKVKLPKKEGASKWIKRLGNDTDLVLSYISYTPSSLRDMDIWRFSYFTMGTDLKDIALMKFSDIENGLWFYNREKTGEGGVGKPLIKEAMDIVLKYHDPSNKYVFNWILQNGKYDKNDRIIRDRTNQIVWNLRRRYMKVSFELALDGHFTWRSARYSSASNVVNKGGNVKDVQVLMDHSSVTTTERYARYANHQNMKKALELLRPVH